MLYGLQQSYVELKDGKSCTKQFELLDVLELNQLVIFVKSVQGCVTLSQLLIEQDLSAIVIHGVKMGLKVIKQREKEAVIVKDNAKEFCLQVEQGLMTRNLARVKHKLVNMKKGDYFTMESKMQQLRMLSRDAGTL